MIVLDALKFHGASILLQPRLRSERLSFCKKLLMKMDYLKSFTMGSIKK
jgi:hypothetical protein